jgi:hypothetical protein
MTLHGQEDRDYDSAGCDGIPMFVVDPPIMKGLVWVDEEALFECWCLSKHIRDISAMDDQVLSSRYCIKDPGTCLVNTITSVREVQNTNLSQARRAIQRTASFLAVINLFDVVQPNQIEDRFIRHDMVWGAEHLLRFILV